MQFEVMLEGTGRQGGRGQEGIHQNSVFYADDGMLAFLDPGWLPGAFITLVGLFERVGWYINFGNMVRMVYRPLSVAPATLLTVFFLPGTGGRPF